MSTLISSSLASSPAGGRVNLKVGEIDGFDLELGPYMVALQTE
jgi:hypothetical protein